MLHEIRSEYAQLMTCLFLLVAGPGPWSLDAWLRSVPARATAGISIAELKGGQTNARGGAVPL